ncbi:Stk1 family PASTA domain-containing Ser/Thr kinase [Pseudonocardia humida]|uniref:non-specific serine/threonine protein kinase n=1 Tax=Pseudonocardia humida TaxID=2800819 RepID=A0ABT1A4T4_9PSEU|nr:Stk1 family PASTA domain-containing Ser/Thr kinase [Pseudonocardia humida]MCO1658018.1 Stk1 family PASTA domain-containing Ser/Thr kinase [Pseudonocardia humida]
MTTSRLLSDRYELGEVLGYGGMSEVHRGLDTRLGRDVAIKVLRADLARDPQFQLRFRREAQNSAGLNHPAIVAVYDTGEVEGEFGPLPYIVMEFVDGQTLREIVKTEGPMSQQRVTEVMADVCAALDFSHRHGIIHRDVKPANIMITRGGAVKVMDFGIARALGEGQNVTQTAAVIGTAQYLSPEQARGEAVDARSDVYAAGCVLFELLTGEPPFTGDTPVAVAYQHVREDPRSPSQVNPNIPPALDAVILKALSKNPANRYQSAAELRADLVRVRAGQNPMAPAVMSEDERTAMLAASAGGVTRRTNGRHGPPTGGGGPATDYGYYDEEPQRSTGRIVGIVVAVLAVIGIVGFGAYQYLAPPSEPTKVAVPTLVGQTEEAARSQLVAARLRVGEVVQVPSSVEDRGKVTQTDPPVGAQINESTAVKLSVGAGPAEVTVPRLVGGDPDEAEAELKAVGLVLGSNTSRETPDQSQVGKIIETDPEPGVKVAGGSEVNIVVGKKQTTVEIPDVQGKDPQEAANQLAALGLDVNREAPEVEGPGEKGTVAETDPPAKAKVDPGSKIQIKVSDGSQAEVPDIDGLSESEARAKLAEVGIFNIKVTEQGVDDDNQDGKVIDHSAEAGEGVDKDDQFTIVIGNKD